MKDPRTKKELDDKKAMEYRYPKSIISLEEIKKLRKK